MTETFGQWLRRFRKDVLRMTQEGLADASSLSGSYISQLENGLNPSTGKPPKLSVEKLKGLAKGLKLPVEEVMRLAGFMPPTGQAESRSERQRRAIAVLESLPEDRQDEYLEMWEAQAEVAVRKDRQGRHPGGPNHPGP